MPDNSEATITTTIAHPQRILSVDVARGVTIAFMILVNDPGDWSHVYTQFDHSAWNGWTLTDLVFPNFLFLIGAAIVFSLQSRMARGESRAKLAAHILRRAAILFALDLFLAAFPHFELTQLRLFGVLTRIALCYLCVSLICLVTRRIQLLAVIAATLLISYWLLLRFVPVPGLGLPGRDIPFMDPNANLTSWIDRAFNGVTQRLLHTGRLYRGTRDPEGLLSTLPAVATTLLGAIAGLVLKLPNIPSTRKRNLLGLGAVLFLTAGELWNVSFPINKNLWTSSFVLFTAGCSLLGLTLAFWFVDERKTQERSTIARAMLWPWLVLGSNAIVAYVISELLSEILTSITLQNRGTTITAAAWIYLHLFSHGRSTELTSLAFAIVFTAVCFLPNWLLWHRRIYVKI